MAIQQYQQQMLKKLTSNIDYFQYAYVYVCERVAMYLFVYFNLAAH